MKDGSYSIEAAIIMPLVTVIILVFILFGFYLRDIVFVEALARNIILEAADDTDKAEISVTLEDVQTGLWCAKVRQFSVLDEKKKTEVRYELASDFKFLDIPIEKMLRSEKKEKSAVKLRRWKVITDMAKDYIKTGEK